MIEFVLKFCEAIVRKRKEKRDALVGCLRVADFVRLDLGKIVLLRRHGSANATNGKQSARTREG